MLPDMSLEFYAIILTVICSGGFVFAQWYFAEAKRVKRALAAAPITAVATLLEGDTVRVVGTLLPGPSTLTAPLSGRPCAAYLLRVREQMGKSWKEIIRESDAVEFAVDDGSGTVLVRPGNFKLGLEDDHNERTGFWSDPSERVKEYLLARGESAEGALGLKRVLQFNEAVLEEGERVAVWATVMLETDPATTGAGEGYRDRPKRERKVLIGPADGAMLLSDAPKVTT
jgi:hypothetical protein